MCVWDLPQSLVSSALNCITLWLGAGLSPPILLGVQTEDLCLSAWEVTLNYFLKMTPFHFLSAFSLEYWSSHLDIGVPGLTLQLTLPFLVFILFCKMKIHLQLYLPVLLFVFIAHTLFYFLETFCCCCSLNF